jgi:hypothetical protein
LTSSATLLTYRIVEWGDRNSTNKSLKPST